MARIICLANSRKHGLHCVAGIDPQTGRWVRPISMLQDGALRPETIMVGGQQPALLDIVEFPEDPRPAEDFAFQPENVLLGRGPWRKVGRASAEDVLEFCQSGRELLHNTYDRVPHSYLVNLPRSGWKSLQLVLAVNVVFRTAASPSGKMQCRAQFTFPFYGGQKYDLAVTDPVSEGRTGGGSRAVRTCILTVSLGMPWPENSPDAACFKLIAGVIET